jgi:hypothetical protein
VAILEAPEITLGEVTMGVLNAVDISLGVFNALLIPPTVSAVTRGAYPPRTTLSDVVRIGSC